LKVNKDLKKKPVAKAAPKDAKAATKKAAKPAAKAAQPKTAKVAKTGAKAAAKPKAAKVEAAKKALKIAKTIKKGNSQRTARKVHYSVHFHRPKTLKLQRNPKYPRTSIPKRNKLDQYRVLKYPLTTETAMKKIEDDNTLVFVVDQSANKNHIRESFKKMYEIRADRINTLIRPDGEKKAFIRLPTDVEAMDVAAKIGIM
jgi:large subunit ribosomal protein L23Ae